MTTTFSDSGKLLLTEEEAAQMIGLSARFMQARRARGGGPAFVRVSSRCVRYRVEDIREWAAANVRKSTADRPR